MGFPGVRGTHLCLGLHLHSITLNLEKRRFINNNNNNDILLRTRGPYHRRKTTKSG